MTITTGLKASIAALGLAALFSPAMDAGAAPGGGVSCEIRMVKSGGGVILNITSGLSRVTDRGCVAYGTSKAALSHMTRLLANEFAPKIRVNAIAPGPVLWPERDLDETLKSEIVARTALKRAGSPDDVARTALCLASEAPCVTGQVIVVDGGSSL